MCSLHICVPFAQRKTHASVSPCIARACAQHSKWAIAATSKPAHHLLSPPAAALSPTHRAKRHGRTGCIAWAQKGVFELKACTHIWNIGTRTHKAGAPGEEPVSHMHTCCNRSSTAASFMCMTFAPRIRHLRHQLHLPFSPRRLLPLCAINSTAHHQHAPAHACTSRAHTRQDTSTFL